VTALERFAAWVAAESDSSRDVALHLADGVGAWIAGRGTAEGRAIAGLPADDLPARVARHCACARLSEIDDIHLASATTPGGAIVPAAIAVAASIDADAAALARAVDAGYEAMTRLGRAIDGPSVLYRGVWPTYFAAPFGVAAACARLFELDEAKTAHALAIAHALAAPGVGRPAGVHAARWIAFGNACANGVRAAFWAMDGFTGDLGLLDGDFLPSVYGVRSQGAALTERLGETRAAAETSFKPWCAARQTMAAAQAWTELAAEGVAPADVREIRVAVPPPYFKMVNHGVTPGERLSHLTSVPYQVALAALSPEARHDVQQTPAALAPAVRAFMDKVKVEPDGRLLEHYPAAWPARVTAVTGIGAHERLMQHVPGDPRRAWGESDLLEKFRHYGDLTLANAIINGRVAASDLVGRIATGPIRAT
jgi:2-methylcitrate dehydratase PrpD